MTHAIHASTAQLPACALRRLLQVRHDASASSNSCTDGESAPPPPDPPVGSAPLPDAPLSYMLIVVFDVEPIVAVFETLAIWMVIDSLASARSSATIGIVTDFGERSPAGQLTVVSFANW